MKALVTGGAGFIGRHLCAHLSGKSIDVVVVDDGGTGKPDQLGQGIRVVNREISTLTIEQWGELLIGVDFVFHLAARKYNTPGVTAQQIIDTNVTATWRLATASASAGVRRLIFTSSLYAYGGLGPEVMSEDLPAQPRTLYGSSKLMGEGILRTVGHESGLSWNCVRLFFIYGPGQFADGGYKSVVVTNFERIRQGLAPTICGDGAQALDYVFVGDAVDALWAVAESATDKQVVNVCAGVPRSVASLTDTMLEVSGTRLLPEEIAPDWTAGTRRVGDPSKALEVFGWSTQTGLADGLRQTWAEVNDSMVQP